MPMVIECIDQIARRLGRDILFADIPEALRQNVLSCMDENVAFDPETLETRQKAIAFLNAEGIDWTPCYSFSSTSGWLSCPYYGTIFIDVPNMPDDKNYKKVCGFFETADGEPLYDDYQLFLFSYALKR